MEKGWEGGGGGAQPLQTEFVGNCDVTKPNGAVGSNLSTDIGWWPTGLANLLESECRL